jgi:hypothetical protein
MNENRTVPISQLIESLSVYSGTTTADGAVGCTSLVDANLIGLNDFITNQVHVLIQSGNSWREKQVALTFTPATGTITFAAFSHQILAGTIYKLLNVAGVSSAAIQAAILSDATPFPGADIALIKVVTDALPDAGALTTLQGYVTAIKAVTDVIPDAGALTTLQGEVESSSLVTGAGSIADNARLGALVRYIADNPGGGGGGGITVYPSGINVPDGGVLTISSSALVIGDVTVGIGSFLTISGNLQVTNQINIASTGTLIVCGNCITGSISNLAGTINIYGNCQITVSGGGIVNTTGTTTIVGNLDAASTSIVQSDIGTIVINGDCEAGSIYLTDSGNVNVGGNCTANTSGIVHSGTGTLEIMGDCHAEPNGVQLTNTGTIQIFGNLYAINGGITNTVGNIQISGDAILNHGGMTNTTGVITISGTCTGGIGQNGSGSITINGNVAISSGGITNTTGSITIYGDCQMTGFITLSDIGSITIYGKCVADVTTAIAISSTGTITINGDLVIGSIMITGAGVLTFKTGTVAGDITCMGSINGLIKFTNGGYHQVDFNSAANAAIGNIESTFDELVIRNMLWSNSLNKINIHDAATLIIEASCVSIGLDLYGTGALTNSMPAGVTPGTMTEALDPLVMTDAAASFVPDSLIGLVINNTTDPGASGTITANDATTITCSGGLSGGILNTWTLGDGYTVPFPVNINDFRLSIHR